MSFPKCGRTWLRVLVGRALQVHYGLPDDTDVTELAHLAELDPRVPSVLVTHDDDAQWKAPADVERDKGGYRHRRVILLVRDPRDVIVSLYHQMGGRRGQDVGTPASFVDRPERRLRVAAACSTTPGPRRSTCRPRCWWCATRTSTPTPRASWAGSWRSSACGTSPPPPWPGRSSTARSPTCAAWRRRGRSRRGGCGRVGDAYKTRRGTVGGHRDELDAAVVAHLDELMAASPGAAAFGYEP